MTVYDIIYIDDIALFMVTLFFILLPQKKH